MKRPSDPPRRSSTRRAAPLPRKSESPVRTCAGCGRKAPQAELVRFAAVGGELQAGRTLPGRGVYTCRRLACFERTLTRRGFNRVLRRNVSVDPALARLYTRTSNAG